MAERQEFNDVVSAIHSRLQTLSEMGYSIKDEFVAKMIAQYCVDVAPVVIKEGITYKQ